MRFAFSEQRVRGDAASVRPAVGVSGRSTSKRSPPLIKPRLRTIPSRIYPPRTPSRPVVPRRPRPPPSQKTREPPRAVARRRVWRSSESAPKVKAACTDLLHHLVRPAARAVVWATRCRAARRDRAVDAVWCRACSRHAVHRFRCAQRRSWSLGAWLDADITHSHPTCRGATIVSLLPQRPCLPAGLLPEPFRENPQAGAVELQKQHSRPTLTLTLVSS